MSQSTTAIPAFDYLPEVIALGRDALQRLSDEWLQTSAAKEHGVKQITVKEERGRLLIEDVVIEVLYDPEDKSLDPRTVHFPIDDLVTYIIERGIIAPEARLRLKQIVRARRERSGQAYQRYKTRVPRRLFIRCKNDKCQRIFETQYSIVPGQKWGGSFEPFDCPACGTTNSLSPEDFFALDAPEEKPVDVNGLLGENEKWFSLLIPWRPTVFSLIAPLVGRINREEFEGHEAETVMFLGPQGSSSLPLGRLYFTYRERSFNKLFRKETESWEEVRHVATNKTLYDVADFRVLSALKIEALAREGTENCVKAVE